MTIPIASHWEIFCCLQVNQTGTEKKQSNSSAVEAIKVHEKRYAIPFIASVCNGTYRPNAISLGPENEVHIYDIHFLLQINRQNRIKCSYRTWNIIQIERTKTDSFTFCAASAAAVGTAVIVFHLREWCVFI